MDEKLYYGRGKDCDNKELIAFLDEVFFIDDDPETKRDFISILPKIYHDEYRPAYNNFVVQDENGELTVLIHGKKADEKLRIAVKNNEVTVEKFDGEAEVELSHFEATRAFLSNFTFEREKLSGAAQQWFPLPAFIFSTDQM